MYIQVNIGRNVGRVEMSGEEWAAFKRTVRSALATTVGTNQVDHHDGFGVWDGVSEHSAHLSAYVPRGVTAARLDILRDALRGAAHTFNQDAVALIVTESELIGA